jgi:hypothetical protein
MPCLSQHNALPANINQRKSHILTLHHISTKEDTESNTRKWKLNRNTCNALGDIEAGHATTVRCSPRRGRGKRVVSARMERGWNNDWWASYTAQGTAIDHDG